MSKKQSAEELKEIEEEWEKLKKSFFNSVDKKMFFYIKMDLKTMATFLKENKKYVSCETYKSIIKLITALRKAEWHEASISEKLKRKFLISFNAKLLN